MTPPPWPIRIVRSSRRHRSVGARLVDGVVEVRVPARMTEAVAQEEARKLHDVLLRRYRRSTVDQAGLEQRARDVNRRWFGGRFRWTSIEYVTNMTSLHGSCTPSSGRIRIADRLEQVPRWVLDYVIAHELVHLEHRDHSRRFWDAVAAYPLTERARGYLMGMQLAPPQGDPSEVTPLPGQQALDL